MENMFNLYKRLLAYNRNEWREFYSSFKLKQKIV